MEDEIDKALTIIEEQNIEKIENQIFKTELLEMAEFNLQMQQNSD